MTTLCSINTLTKSLADNCLGRKRPGGINGKIYVGQRPSVATLVIGTNGEITGLTLGAGKKLFSFEGKKFEHDNKGSLVVQEPRNMFKHGGTYKFYPYTAAERQALEELYLSERMFTICVTTAGQVIVDGLDINPYNPTDFDDDRGLKPTAGEFKNDIQFTENSGATITVEGNFFCLPKIYKPSQTLAANIAELDALCV